MGLYRQYIEGKLTKLEYEEMRQKMMCPSLSQDVEEEMISMFLDEQSSVEIPDSVQELMRDNIRKETHKGNLRKQIVRWSALAASILLPVFILSTCYLYMRLQTEGEMSASILVEKGQKASITLPDGSAVSLNGGSSLAYDFNKSKKYRRVKLKGEAFFDVKHDASSPFLVETSDIEVEVLGTTFNVNSYAESNLVSVALDQGKVKLRHTADKGDHKYIYLSQSQQYTFDKATVSGEISFMDKHSVMGWKSGDLVFAAEPLGGIFKKIERWYGVQIHVDLSNIEKDNFTGTFRSISALEVMNILQVHYNFRYKMENNTISVY